MTIVYDLDKCEQFKTYRRLASILKFEVPASIMKSGIKTVSFVYGHVPSDTASILL